MIRYLVLLRGINVGVGTPPNKSMTIRSWQRTLALLERMEASEADA